MNALLLRAEPEDYARLVAGRWRRALKTVFICALLAAGILVFDYRLMLFAFIVMLPSVLAVADPVKLKQSAAALGNTCAVRWEGDRLLLNEKTSLRFADIKQAISFPDAVVIVTGALPARPVGHPLPATRGPNQEPLLAVLRGRNVDVHEERASTPVAGVAAAGFGVVAYMAASTATVVLTLGGIINAVVVPLYKHTWPDRSAAMYFAGAAVAFALQIAIPLLTAFVATRGQTNKN